MGERGDIIKTLHRELKVAGLARAMSDHAIFDAADTAPKPVVGRIAGRGLSDELNDRHYLVLDGVDGRAYYVDIGEARDELPTGSIIRVTGRPAEARDVDRTIARIAGRNAGRYSAELHHLADPSASREYVATHVRRLEAMRRLAGAVERDPDGNWKIAPDHLARASAFEHSQARKSPIIVETLSRLPLQQQISTDGATWLDRTLVNGGGAEFRDTGFGREAQGALAQRRQWLIEQGFAEVAGEGTIYRPDMLAALARRELAKAGQDIARDSGLAYAEAGKKIEGIYRRAVDLASGRYAMIEKSREFTLVPWQPVLERQLGKAVSGIGRGDTISWSVGRQRGGPGGS